jgi:hypothetical protein
MSETQVAEKPAKTPVERTEVEMEDGSVFSFAGARKVDKRYEVDTHKGTVTVVLRFRNGAIRKISSHDIARETQLTALGHGLVQKIGDEWSGTTDVEDIVLTADEMIARLKAGEWGVTREAGDSMAGASVVIRAICEATGKGVADVKAFLDGKLEAAKARGEKLSRQELYSSFRNPKSKTGAIIKRLEEEKAAKSSKFNSDELLDEIV